MAVLRRGLGWFVFGVWGCAPDLTVPERGVETDMTRLHPAPASGVTSRSVRITTTASRPRLFAKALSSQKVTEVRSGNASPAPSKDEVTLVAVTTAPDAGAGTGPGEARTWLPDALLEAGHEYTLITTHDQVAFTTLDDEVALKRRWPAALITARGVFCVETTEQLALGAPGDEAVAGPSTSILFGETIDAGAASQWEGLAGAPCWAWQANGRELFPEAPARGAVQPTWGGAASGSPPAKPGCDPEEVTLEFGCATVSDDRVFIRAGETSSFWQIHGGASAWFVLEPGTSGVIKGLASEHHYEFRAEVWFSDADSLVQTFSMQTSAVSPHVVINEVMADPVGNEPDQEWVELYNDGRAPVNLEGWRLADGGGEMSLPAVSIAPLGYLLLVNDTYVPMLPGEPVPEPNVSIVRLPVLAKSGLSNAGEALRLLDKSDKVVSSFPGTLKPAPGVSVARVAPWLVDSDPNAFGAHAIPGASPGGVNHVRADVAGNE